MRRTLYPPYLEGTLPAYTGGNLKIPFSMNPSVSIGDVAKMSLKIKSATGDRILTSSPIETSNFYEENGYYVAEFDGSLIKSLILEEKMILGFFYKCQLAYVGVGQDPKDNYYSTVGVIKYTSKPDVEIAGLSKDKINIAYYDYLGVYSQEDLTDIGDKDSTEKEYQYSFSLFNKDGVEVENSGLHYHDASKDVCSYKSSDEHLYDTALNGEEEYFAQYKTVSRNGVETTSPKYRIMDVDTVPSDLKAYLHAEMDRDNGCIVLSLVSNGENGAEIAGTYRIDRYCEGKWMPLKLFSLNGGDEYDWAYRDFLVEHGKEYSYCIRQYSQTTKVLSSRIPLTRTDEQTGEEVETTIFAEFEDMFLYDGELQLKVQFKPQVSSFKTTILEQKQDTIGGKYPFIYRNGHVAYKEFPISGLISYWVDNDWLFSTPEELRLEEDIFRSKTDAIRYKKLSIVNKDFYSPNVYYVKDGENYISTKSYCFREKIKDNYEDLYTRFASNGKLVVYDKVSVERSNIDWRKKLKRMKTTDLVDYNVYAERIFKLKVLDWLNDGRTKLFRSPTEGNYFVRLMNNTLTPIDTVGRMLHTFNSNAVEVGDYNRENLIGYGFITLEEPNVEQYQVRTIKLLQKDPDGNYSFKTGELLNEDIYTQSTEYNEDEDYYTYTNGYYKKLGKLSLEQYNNGDYYYTYSGATKAQSGMYPASYVHFDNITPGTEVEINGNSFIIGATGEFEISMPKEITSVVLKENDRITEHPYVEVHAVGEAEEISSEKSELSTYLIGADRKSVSVYDNYDNTIIEPKTEKTISLINFVFNGTAIPVLMEEPEYETFLERVDDFKATLEEKIKQIYSDNYSIINNRLEDSYEALLEEIKSYLEAKEIIKNIEDNRLIEERSELQETYQNKIKEIQSEEGYVTELFNLETKRAEAEKCENEIAQLKTDIEENETVLSEKMAENITMKINFSESTEKFVELFKNKNQEFLPLKILAEGLLENSSYGLPESLINSLGDEQQLIKIVDVFYTDEDTEDEYSLEFSEDKYTVVGTGYTESIDANNEEEKSGRIKTNSTDSTTWPKYEPNTYYYYDFSSKSYVLDSQSPVTKYDYILNEGLTKEEFLKGIENGINWYTSNESTGGYSEVTETSATSTYYTMNTTGKTYDLAPDNYYEPIKDKDKKVIGYTKISMAIKEYFKTRVDIKNGKDVPYILANKLEYDENGNISKLAKYSQLEEVKEMEVVVGGDVYTLTPNGKFYYYKRNFFKSNGTEIDEDYENTIENAGDIFIPIGSVNSSNQVVENKSVEESKIFYTEATFRALLGTGLTQQDSVATTGTSRELKWKTYGGLWVKDGDTYSKVEPSENVAIVENGATSQKYVYNSGQSYYQRAPRIYYSTEASVSEQLEESPYLSLINGEYVAVTNPQLSTIYKKIYIDTDYLDGLFKISELGRIPYNEFLRMLQFNILPEELVPRTAFCKDGDSYTTLGLTSVYDNAESYYYYGLSNISAEDMIQHITDNKDLMGLSNLVINALANINEILVRRTKNAENQVKLNELEGITYGLVTKALAFAEESFNSSSYSLELSHLTDEVNALSKEISSLNKQYNNSLKTKNKSLLKANQIIHTLESYGGEDAVEKTRVDGFYEKIKEAYTEIINKFKNGYSSLPEEYKIIKEKISDFSDAYGDAGDIFSYDTVAKAIEEDFVNKIQKTRHVSPSLITTFQEKDSVMDISFFEEVQFKKWEREFNQYKDTILNNLASIEEEIDDIIGQIDDFSFELEEIEISFDNKVEEKINKNNHTVNEDKFSIIFSDEEERNIIKIILDDDYIFNSHDEILFSVEYNVKKELDKTVNKMDDASIISPALGHYASQNNIIDDDGEVHIGYYGKTYSKFGRYKNVTLEENPGIQVESDGNILSELWNVKSSPAVIYWVKFEKKISKEFMETDSLDLIDVCNDDELDYTINLKIGDCEEVIDLTNICEYTLDKFIPTENDIITVGNGVACCLNYVAKDTEFIREIENCRERIDYESAYDKYNLLITKYDELYSYINASLKTADYQKRIEAILKEFFGDKYAKEYDTVVGQTDIEKKRKLLWILDKLVSEDIETTWPNDEGDLAKSLRLEEKYNSYVATVATQLEEWKGSAGIA